MPNTAMMKWQYIFSAILMSCIIYIKPFVTTEEVKLRLFQYRILNRILATNSLAYKLNLIDSEHCTFSHDHR